MRYAVYFLPAPDTALAATGAAWLGRDAVADEDLPQPAAPGIDADRFRTITADPRRYGFHATLKPPFALADGCTEDELRHSFTEFAASRSAFSARLEVGRIDGFVAIVPAVPTPELHALADAAVEGLDRFRAPPGEAELERRRRHGLAPAEEANLRRWGYPYVFEAFRFHLTLSQRLAGEEADRVEAAARAGFSEVLADPVPIDTLGLFVEPQPGAPFRVHSIAALDQPSS